MTNESTTDTSSNRKPAVFKLADLDAGSDEPKSSKSTSKKPNSKPRRKPAAAPKASVEPTPDPFDLNESQEDEIADFETEPARLRSGRFGFAKLFFAAFGLLASLGVGLAIDGLVRQLLATYPPLGWFALALTGIALAIAIGFAAREIWALRSLRKLDEFRQKIDVAIAENDSQQGKSISANILKLYKSRPQMAKQRAVVEAHENDLLDATTRLELTETALMADLDDEAKRIITKAASRVAVVTAVSPRALVDVGYVLFENMRLIRNLALLYGTRPGFLGSLRLAGSVIGHLAVTGTIAIGDSLMQQVVGTGVAARISARFGEGVVNGLLTARIGISANDLCRPMPFRALPRPKISDFVNPLTALSSKK